MLGMQETLRIAAAALRRILWLLAIPGMLLASSGSASAQVLDLQVESFSVSYSHDFAYLSGSENVSMDIVLETSVNCTGTGTILAGTFFSPPTFQASVDLVEVSLGTVVAKLPISTFPVPAAHVSGRPSGSFPGICFSGYSASGGPVLSVADLTSTAGFEAFIATARASGNSVQARVEIDSTALVAETNEANNEWVEPTVLDLYPLSGTLLYGAISVPLDTATVVGGVCPAGQAASLSVQGTWQPSPGNPWTPVPVSVPAPQCLKVIANGNQFDLKALGDTSVGTASGSLAGFAVDVSNVVLGPTGARPGQLSLELPEGHTHHADDGSGRPEARGRRQITFAAVSPAATSDFDLLQAGGLAGFLHARSNPLSFELVSLSLTATSLDGKFAAAVYPYNVDFSPRDPRIRAGLQSNDQRMRLPSAGTFLFSLLPSGLQTSVAFDPGVGGLHFPALRSSWNNFSLNIIDGRLEENGVLSPEIYGFTQSSDCPGCDEDKYGVGFNLAASHTGTDWDGASVARVSALGADPEWGPLDPNSGLQIYTRSGDINHPAVVAVPGFHAQATGGGGDVSVAEYLLGMREAVWNGTIVKFGAHHLLPSTESRSGNFFMAGVSVGPDLYSSGPLNQPMVGTLGSDLGERGIPTDPAPGLMIGFGGILAPDYHYVPNNSGAKYVVRPAGVTGVFNSDMAPSPTVYGYTLPLTRFGIRQVVNEIDPYSWIDGKVVVPGKGDFEIVFQSLELECSGDIGQGLVVRETCGDGVGGDVNCNETLSAWNTRMEEILGIAFEGIGDQCQASNRELEVASVIDIKALEDWVGLTATWSSAGDPSNEVLTSTTDQVWDSPDGGVTPGFSTAMSEDVHLDLGGYYIFKGDVGVPFWEALDAEMRFQNEAGVGGEFVRAQSIAYSATGGCVFPDHLGMSSADLSQELEVTCNVDADYTWGGTGWEMTFPVFFETGRYEQGESPRFLGNTIEGDLVVMDVNAGTDFITPEQTQVSFGASADFARLRDLAAVVDLHVDLNDPESIEKIDFFLNDVFGTPLNYNGQVDCGPVCGVVSTLRDRLDLLNVVADAGLDGFIEDAVREVVRSVLDAVPGLDTAIGAVDSLPEEITGRVVEALRTELVALVEPLTADFEGRVNDLYATGTASLAQAVTEVNALGSVQDPVLRTTLENLRSEVQGILSALEAVDNAALAFDQQGLARAQAAVAEIRSEKALIVGSATTAISALEVSLGSAVQFTNCGAGNPVIDKIDELEAAITDVKTALDSLDLVSPIGSVAGVVGVDLSAIEQAQQTIRELADDTSSRIAELQSRITGLCAGVAYTPPLTDALTLLANMKSAISTLDSQLDLFLDKLDVDTDAMGPLDGGYLGLVNTSLGAARGVVTDIRSRVEEVDVFLETALADPALLLAAPASAFLNTAAGAYDFSQAAGWKQFFDDQIAAATGGSIPDWSSLVAGLPNYLTDPVLAVVDTIAVEVTNMLAAYTALVPHPNLDDFEDQLVALIMNSPIIETLENEVYAFTSELVEDLNVIGLAVFDQLNAVIGDVLQAANEFINEAFAAATSAVEGWELGAAEMDGYALMTGNELSKLHVGAEFEMGGEEDGFGFKAALDVTSWSANGKETGCGIDPGSGSLLDVVISTYDLPLNLGESEILMTELYLGFTVQDLAPVGLFGGVFTSGEIAFSEFSIYDPGMALGAGAYENYFGATAGASFDSVSMQVAFLVGRTCNQDVIVSLDPQVGEFLTFPDSGFAGLFVRGSANIPVWSNGCFLTVGVGADAGTWILGPSPVTVGMLVGGAVYGEGACLVSVRGQITILAEVSGITSLNPSALASLVPDNVKLQGEAFFVGGFGFDCDPGTWTSVSRSRKDDWCGTGDLSTGASYDGSFHLQTPKLSAIH